MSVALWPGVTRYASWLDRRWLAVTLASAAVLAASLYLTAFHLPLRADFSYLLPADAPRSATSTRLAERHARAATRCSR